MKTWMGLMLVIALSSCVSKARYEKVVSSVHSKEKQQVKLQKQLDELRQTNQALRDSAERMNHQ